MGDIDWRQQLVAKLAADPGDWRTLGDLFYAMELAIPMHMALRAAASKRRRQRSSQGKEVRIEDLDVAQARWHLFISFVLPLVDRQACDGGPPPRYARRDDQVHLKPSDQPCAACNGLTYLARWPGKGETRAYSCPRCDANDAALPIIPEPIQPDAERVPNVQRAEPQPIAEPKPEIVRKTVFSLEEAWNTYEDAMTKKDRDNPKLYRTLRKAFDAGCLTEYEQIQLSPVMELTLLDPTTVLVNRAMIWARHHLSPNRLRRWDKIVCNTHAFGAMTVLSFNQNGNGGLILPEIKRLAARKPKPIQVQSKPNLLRKTIGRFLSPRKRGPFFRNWT